MNTNVGEAKAEAQRSYRHGGELADNPYLAGTPEYEAYQWEMHRLEVAELVQLRAELESGV